jgi:microcompartment protein CcmK/EutM
MGMSREDSAFPLGSLVLVKRGHHAGSVFAVVGIERGAGKNELILIADGERISARKPKRKNPRHIVKAEIVSDEIATRLAGGKCIDDGWLAEVLNRQKKEISRLILEEVG